MLLQLAERCLRFLRRHVKGAPLNSNAAQFFMPSSIYVDPQNGRRLCLGREGRGGNKRIAVMDATASSWPWQRRA